MTKSTMDRREFLRICGCAGAAIGGLSIAEGGGPGPAASYDSKGLPTRVLGSTGVAVPLIVIGCGSRFCAVSDPDESAALLEAALDHGLYYWDTAHDYAVDDVVSEERLGLVLKDRRREVFLASKLSDRSYEGAMRQLEESLRRLQTDRLDLCQVHSVESMEDVEKIFAADGVVRALERLKEQGVTRFIGFSGHASADAMTAMVNRHDFDTMLIALNHYQWREGDMEGHAIPAAANKGMGVLAMKVVRPQETVEGVRPDELIRYALGLDHVHAAVIGTDSVDVLRANVELVRGFEKMAPDEVARIEHRLQPFFDGDRLPWLDPSYTDGIPA
jgi:predicted aldo/keto reductase-like oxidoreductase